jgi:hypothetical protein
MANRLLTRARQFPGRSYQFERMRGGRACFSNSLNDYVKRHDTPAAEARQSGRGGTMESFLPRNVEKLRQWSGAAQAGA